MSEVLYHRLRYMLSPQLDVYRSIAERFPPGGPGLREGRDRALDYGMGTGIGALQLAGAGWATEVWDPDPHARHFVSETMGGFLKVWDRPPPIKSGFHLLVAIEVLEHVEDPESALALFDKLVITGGRIIVTTINSEGSYKKNHAHSREWDPQGFEYLLEKHARGKVVVTDSRWKHLDWGSTPMVATWVKGEVDVG